ncbi:MAG: gliding motility-associated C-terminal domain-containing protein [Bacteroidetes bacterium]|nr:gliding motility-associated C-terminal domain-containing protein [Bacteroidota bacterium]
MLNKRQALFFLCIALGLLFQFSDSLATHNRAGEITYRQLGPLTYEATIVTYTETTSPADRPKLELRWGDNTSDTLNRISKVTVGPNISRNLYIGTHTYPGPGFYKMSLEDPNRNAGVVNIPGSVNVPFYIETQLVLQPQLGYNNSPILLEPPIDNGALNQIFIHNPNAYDPDGDSLSYELIICKGFNGANIPGYIYPPAANSFSLNSTSGDLIWDFPQFIGEYNVAFLIREWRNGFNIGFVERDMQITILPSTNLAPFINPVPDLCVEAGSFINFDVTATDPDTNGITLSATGAPLDAALIGSSPATFPPINGSYSVTGTFQWQTNCDHVRRLPYRVLFKAKDNDPDVNLVDFETVNITVVAPSPKNPSATPQGNSINLAWDAEVCTDAIGYKIYRRNSFYGFTPSQCETGVPPYTGYQFIAQVSGLNNVSFTDNNNGNGLIPGIDYCYMIAAYFPDSALSYASIEVCTELIRDVPVITNVSITSTDVAAGTVYLAWSSPKVIDSTQTPPPYEYKIYRSADLTGNNFVFIASTFGLNDTTFNDIGLNTKDNGLTYKIEWYSNGTKIGETLKASSVFLNTSPTDNKVVLSWTENVPWQNVSYNVYRKDVTGNFVLIANTPNQTFTDTALINNSEYCYRIESIGAYSGGGFVDPILNFSQEKCDTPVDNVAPCTPSGITIVSDCVSNYLKLTWNNPNYSCADDVLSYIIYYTEQVSDEPVPLITIPNTTLQQIVFELNNPDSAIAGCYYLSAVDSAGNESPKTNAICQENCPEYILPNVFTPNADGINDFFEPIKNRYIKSIAFTVYNRWGQLVFETDKPEINWDGGKLSDGVYYYVCTVNEIFIDGIKPRKLRGNILIINSK